jgi:hypothetical protein
MNYVILQCNNIMVFLIGSQQVSVGEEIDLKME